MGMRMQWMNGPMIRIVSIVSEFELGSGRPFEIAGKTMPERTTMARKPNGPQPTGASTLGVPVRLGGGLAFSVKRETTRSTISVRPKRPRMPVRMYMTKEREESSRDLTAGQLPLNFIRTLMPARAMNVSHSPIVYVMEQPVGVTSLPGSRSDITHVAEVSSEQSVLA
eukprot:scaffold133272_cov62-Phaeocystis_antarctica.AAC.1